MASTGGNYFSKCRSKVNTQIWTPPIAAWHFKKSLQLRWKSETTSSAMSHLCRWGERQLPLNSQLRWSIIPRAVSDPISAAQSCCGYGRIVHTMQNHNIKWITEHSILRSTTWLLKTTSRYMPMVKSSPTCLKGEQNSASTITISRSDTRGILWCMR